MAIIKIVVRSLSILVLMTCFCFQSFSQDYPNTFNISNFIQLGNSDSIKIYFDKEGRIVNKECAIYYRKGKTGQVYCNVTGQFTDYYSSSAIFFKCSIDNNGLNGNGKYYYKNGNIKESGSYKNDKRSGLWKYYYPDGGLEKELLFGNGGIRIITYVTASGDTLTKKGNGIFAVLSYKYQFRSPDLFKGEVKDSLMEGEWTYSVPVTQDSLPVLKWNSSGVLTYPPVKMISNEQFSKGKLTKAEDLNGTKYKASLINLQGYVVNEGFNIYNNSFGCKGPSLSPPQFSKDSYFTGSYFFPELTNILNPLVKMTEDQWLIVNLSINENNKLDSIIVWSSIDDKYIEKCTGDIIKNRFSDWKSLRRQNKKIPSNLMFTMIIENNEVIIPVYSTHRNFF